MKYAIVVTLAVLTTGCSVARIVGDGFQDFGAEQDNVVGDIATGVGKIYKTVGCSGTGKDATGCDKGVLEQ